MSLIIGLNKRLFGGRRYNNNRRIIFLSVFTEKIEGELTEN